MEAMKLIRLARELLVVENRNTTGLIYRDNWPLVFHPEGDERVVVYPLVDIHIDEFDRDVRCIKWSVVFPAEEPRNRWESLWWYQAETIIRSIWEPEILTVGYHLVWQSPIAAREFRRSIQERDPAIMNASLSLAKLHGASDIGARPRYSKEVLESAHRIGVFSCHPDFDPERDYHEYEIPEVDLKATTWYGEIIDRWIAAPFGSCRVATEKNADIQAMIDGVKRLDPPSLHALSDWMEEKNWPATAKELYPWFIDILDLWDKTEPAPEDDVEDLVSP